MPHKKKQQQQPLVSSHFTCCFLSEFSLSLSLWSCRFSFSLPCFRVATLADLTGSTRRGAGWMMNRRKWLSFPFLYLHLCFLQFCFLMRLAAGGMFCALSVTVEPRLQQRLAAPSSLHGPCHGNTAVWAADSHFSVQIRPKWFCSTNVALKLRGEMKTSGVGVVLSHRRRRIRQTSAQCLCPGVNKSAAAVTQAHFHFVLLQFLDLVIFFL